MAEPLTLKLLIDKLRGKDELSLHILAQCSGVDAIHKCMASIAAVHNIVGIADRDTLVCDHKHRFPSRDSEECMVVDAVGAAKTTKTLAEKRRDELNRRTRVAMGI